MAIDNGLLFLIVIALCATAVAIAYLTGGRR